MGIGVFSAMEVSASGLAAERTRMNTIASNLANSHTTRTASGGPYKRIDPVFEAEVLDKTHSTSSAAAGAVSLVKVNRIVEDSRPGQMVYEPGHPDANKQ